MLEGVIRWLFGKQQMMNPTGYELIMSAWGANPQFLRTSQVYKINKQNVVIAILVLYTVWIFYEQSTFVYPGPFSHLLSAISNSPLFRNDFCFPRPRINPFISNSIIRVENIIMTSGHTTNLAFHYTSILYCDKLVLFRLLVNRGIHADVIAYIFAD